MERVTATFPVVQIVAAHESPFPVDLAAHAHRKAGCPSPPVHGLAFFPSPKPCPGQRLLGSIRRRIFPAQQGETQAINARRQRGEIRLVFVSSFTQRARPVLDR